MTKKILVLLGHPNDKSFTRAMADRYVKGAKHGGANVKYIKVKDLKFDALNFKKELEPDLQKMRKLILWCDHLVAIYPVWWGGLPALLKGFFDRTFGPGFAFRYKENGLGWHKLLKGRSARIVTVTGGPWLLNYFVYKNASINGLKWAALWFAGFSPVKVSEFNGIDTKWSTDKKRKRWLDEVERVGERDAG